MIINEVRNRKKVTPSGYKSGTQTLGYFNSALTSGGVPTGNWSPAQWGKQTLNIAPPYSKAQITIDELHSGPPYKSGGPFVSLKIEFCRPWGVFAHGTYERNDKLVRYVGGFGPPADPLFRSNPGVANLNISLVGGSPHVPSMDGLGDKAYNSAKPNPERASVFVFLVELRDAPRMLSSTAKRFSDIWERFYHLGHGVYGTSTRQAWQLMRPKQVADDFLNHQFGWTPFINDILKFDEALQKSRQDISQMTMRNGKSTRRRVTLHKEGSRRVVAAGEGVCLEHGGVTNDFFTGMPTWEVSEEKHSHAYAIGRFKYYLPEFDANKPEYFSGWNTAMRNLTYYGARATPSNVYKSIPWSWAVDWVSNAGDHVDYLSDMLTDSVACEYLFVMQHVTHFQRVKQILPFKGGTHELTFTRVIETKQRQVGGGPYGFTLSWDQLTPRQMAIAGALGIRKT